MTQTNPEKKMPVRNLERIAVQKCASYDEAAKYRQVGAPKGVVTLPGNTYAKVKIFARNDNTYDVVWYKKIAAEPVKSPGIEPGDTTVVIKKVPFKKGKKQHQ